MSEPDRKTALETSLVEDRAAKAAARRQEKLAQRAAQEAKIRAERDAAKQRKIADRQEAVAKIRSARESAAISARAEKKRAREREASAARVAKLQAREDAAARTRAAKVIERASKAAPSEASAAATLAELASIVMSDPAIAAGLERLLSQHYGVKISQVGSEHIVPPRSSVLPYVKARKTHTKHILKIESADAPTTIPVFVKASSRPVLTTVDSALLDIPTYNFRTPRFYGQFSCSDLNIAVWEFVEGSRTTFEALSDDLQTRLVRAVAGINAIKLPAAAVPVKTKWVSAPLSWYDLSFEMMTVPQRARWRDVYEKIRRILSDPDRIQTYLQSLGTPLLAHNDINPNNVFTPPDGEILVFDWEGATLSVPGADLRFLHRLQSKQRLLDVYIGEMKRLGIPLAAERVRQGYQVAEAFRLINKGWAKSSLSAVQQGIAIIETGGFPFFSAPGTKTAVKSKAVQMSSTLKIIPPAAETSSGLKKAPSAELRQKVEDYVKTKGALYAPIAHPAFESTPHKWSADRFERVKKFIEPGPGTALDIGSHWGYVAHQLEDMGYDVTACEHSGKHIYFLRELRDLCGKKFTIAFGSIFDLPKLDFDLVIAFNIFHHFLKTDDIFGQFKDFLSRLNCRVMIYQAHRPSERPKLDTAGHYMEPAEMARFIADGLRLRTVTSIGVDGGREIFKLSR